MIEYLVIAAFIAFVGALVYGAVDALKMGTPKH